MPLRNMALAYSTSANARDSSNSETLIFLTMKNAPTFTITAKNGVPFLIRFVRLGDPWGAEFRLTWDGSDACVEFYDTRYPHERDFIGSRAEAKVADAPILGQFVTRYNLSQLTQGRCRHGLILNGGIPDWQVDGDTMAEIMAWIDTVPPAWLPTA